MSDSIFNTVDCVAEAWKCKAGDIDNDHHIEKSAEKECLKTITTELKHLTKGKNYHKHRLQKALIQLCHILLVEHNDELGDRGEAAICLTQMSATKGIKMFGEKAL